MDEAHSKRPDSDAQWYLYKCGQLFESTIFDSRHVADPLFEPAVTQLLIWLHDLLQRADDLDARVSFRDDIADAHGDVTDLISKMRNAACHIRSKNGALDFGVFRFAVICGEHRTALVIDGQATGSEYPDDIAVFYGPYRMYLKRHAARAVEALGAIFGSIPHA